MFNFYKTFHVIIKDKINKNVLFLFLFIKCYHGIEPLLFLIIYTLSIKFDNKNKKRIIFILNSETSGLLSFS